MVDRSSAATSHMAVSPCLGWVLIADDDVGVLQTSERILEIHGYEAETAKCGEQALRLVFGTHFDLILADLRLPDISGVELLRRLRARGIDTPVVIVTGFGTIESAVEAMKLGASDYLEKPLCEESLVHAVEAGLGNERPSVFARHASQVAGFRAHAATRWAAAVIRVIDSSIDPKTLDAWGHLVGMSKSSIRNCCTMAGVSARHSLNFARLLRAVVAAGSQGWRPRQLLDVIDHRTLSVMLAEGGLEEAGPPPPIERFFQLQTLISDPACLDEVRNLLRKRGR